MPAARVPARPALRAPRRPRLHRRRHHLDHRAAHLVHLPVLPVHHAAAGGGGGARQGAAPCHDVVHLQDTLLISSRVPRSPCTLSWCCTIFCSSIGLYPYHVLMIPAPASSPFLRIGLCDSVWMCDACCGFTFPES